MTRGAVSSIELGVARPQYSEFRRVCSVMLSRWVVVFGVVVVVVAAGAAVAADWIAPYDPYAFDLGATLQGPSTLHLLGTDDLGRDLLSRLILGSRVSIIVALIAVAIAGAIGVSAGLVAGYFSGWPNSVIMRLTDAFLSLPALVLMIAVCSALGGGLNSVLIAVGITLAPTYCRLTCGQILSLREADFALAADVIGGSDLRIMFRHLLPNAFAPLLVLISSNLGTAIMFEASLSFLGFGVVAPTPTWGNMVMSGYRYLVSNPLISFAPGIAIMLLVLAFNMVGDGLRDALDPRLRGVLQ